MAGTMDTGRRRRASGRPHRAAGDDALRRRVAALYGVLADLYGADRLVLKAGKLEALHLMRSSRLEDQVLGLMRLVHEDPTLGPAPRPAQVPEALAALEGHLADRMARRSVEEHLEKLVADRMQQRQEEYLREIRIQVLREEAGSETPQAQQKLAQLQKLEQVWLARPVLQVLRPTRLDQVVGQAAAVRAVLARLASPFPQHMILYGPPGVGKTTVARLALEEAKRRPHAPFGPDAPFVEVDATTLRWDPREIANPLLGSVHDPIYQGARRDMAEAAIPEPKLGLVTQAHGGVLFIDEIGELDPLLQNKLLKVLEVPAWIKHLFTHGAPADFVLIGATTRPPEEIAPALRSRCAEVFFQPLTPEEVAAIVRQAADRLGVRLEEGMAERIAAHTTEGRKAVGILAGAYALAVNEAGGSPAAVTVAHVQEVIQAARVPPAVRRTPGGVAVGRAFGLDVSGYVGMVLEVEAVAFPAREPGKGSLRFNEAAGKMARDSLFNAAAVLRQVADVHLADHDVHVNVVGGGRIDGPSAGLAIVLALVSALTGRPLRQHVAVTGEVSLLGEVKPVGGIPEKIFGARQAGMAKVLVPAENAVEVPASPGVAVVPVATVAEALPHVLAS